MTTPSPLPTPYLSHVERTQSSPREQALHLVTVTKIEQVNPSVRLFRLSIRDQGRGIKFHPGQWLDVHVPSPSILKPGGFTITSASLHALPIHERPPISLLNDTNSNPTQDNSSDSNANDSSTLSTPAYLELAIQKSPQNPPAAWLWRDERDVLGQQLLVRVGGSFVWPPPVTVRTGVVPERVVLVAGGVGINPLISILTHLHLTRMMPSRVHLLYSTKATLTDDATTLFLPRLQSIAAAWPPSQLTVTLYATPLHPASTKPNPTPPPQSTTPGSTPSPHSPQTPNNPLQTHPRRITPSDLLAATGATAAERANAVVYICGPRGMTDEFVETIGGFEGVRGENVLCEKWW